MKFILQESKKFILEERFILKEAELDYSTFTSYCTDLISFIKDQLTKVENGSDGDEEKQKIIDKISTETTSLVVDTRNVKDASIIRGKIEDYFNKIDTLLTEVDPSYTTTGSSSKLETIVNNLRAKVPETDNSKEAVSKLQSAISDVDALFQNFMDDLASVNDATSGTTFDKTDQEIILNDLYEDVLKVSKYTEDEYKATPYKALISSGIESLHTNAKVDNMAEFLKLSKSLLDGDFGKKVREESVSGFNSDDVRSDRAGRVDWAKQYKEAGDKDRFWNDYYQTVWGSNAEKIKALGDAFKQECIVLGFTRETNPFIAFIEDYILKQGFPVNSSQYTAIHDEVASNGAISQADLASPQDPLKGGSMILWYKNFYIQASSYDSVATYFDVITSLKRTDYSNLELTSGDDLGADEKKAFANIKSHLSAGGKINSKDAIYNILIDDGVSIKDMLGGTGTGKACPDKPTSGKVRPLADINKILNVLTIKTGSAGASKWDAGSTNELVDAIKGNPDFSANPDEWAKKFIIVIVEAMSADTLASYRSTYSTWWDATTTKTKSLDRLKIKKELEKHGAGIDSTQLKAIIAAFKKEKWLD